MKTTAVVICPGRGTYNAAELGYLARHHAGAAERMAEFDAIRIGNGDEAITALDAASRFSAARHTRGDNASPLIYAASLLDAQAISSTFDIVAVTGNSMGWYTALAAAGAVSPVGGLQIVNTMGALMHRHMIGGQAIYPLLDDNWQPVPQRREDLIARIAEIDASDGYVLSVSIYLGGWLVLAGNDAGLRAFEGSVPKVEARYPMRLPNHAAFHCHLQTPVAEEGARQLSGDLFCGPNTPLIDGRGHIWWPGASDPAALRSYTIGHQVTEPYDFTRAVEVAAREFAPEVFIVTGPGTTLGGAVAQSLMGISWCGLKSKSDFVAQQAGAPLLIAMGREDQRHLATGGKLA